MPGDTKRDLQTVGEFAETAGLPARTLRDDDQIGLFRPSHGDPVSHCRYDFPRQMPEPNWTAPPDYPTLLPTRHACRRMLRSTPAPYVCR